MMVRFLRFGATHFAYVRSAKLSFVTVRGHESDTILDHNSDTSSLMYQRGVGICVWGLRAMFVQP